MSKKTTFPNLQLSDREVRRSIYIAVTIALSFPPLLGGLIMVMEGFYPARHFYRIFGSYTGFYVATVSLIMILAGKFLADAVTRLPHPPDQAAAKTRRFMRRLLLGLIFTILVYTVFGIFSANISFERLGLKTYTLKDMLYTEFGVIPIVLVTVFPLFFYLTDRIGRYMAPRGIQVVAASLSLKLAILGLATPVMIDTFLVSYFMNQYHILDRTLFVLWSFLILIAGIGTWLAVRSLKHSLTPLQKFTDERLEMAQGDAPGTLTAVSLDEIGELTKNLASMIHGNQLLEGRYEKLYTEIRQKEKEMARLNDLLKEAQRLGKIGNWELDLVTNQLTWSDELFHIFEIDKQRFGASYEAFLEMVHPDDREMVNTVYTLSIQNRKRYQTNHRLVTKDGRVKYLQERGETFYANDGKPVRSIGTAQDITEQIQHEKELLLVNSRLEQRVKERTAELSRVNSDLRRSFEELQMAQKQLIQSEKMAALGGLVAGVAHEINTPVGIGMTASSHLEAQVKDFARRYQSGPLSRKDMDDFLSTAAEASELVQANLKRAADLVKSFKQVAVDQSSGERRSFRLREYMNEVLKSLRPRIKKTPHTVFLECPEDVEIYSYPGAFSQIFTNLVMNSLTHGFEGIANGQMTMEIKTKEARLNLRYSDNGKGIDPSHLGRIFEPFFTTDRQKGGSGLGLNIVYNLVTESLGGEITCKSEPGRGVLFEIEVPLEKSETSADYGKPVNGRTG